MLLKRVHFLVIPLLILFSACSSEHSKIVVADFGKYDITMDEFEKAYAKNSGGYEAAKKDSIDEYKKFLNLYVNYKMKLRDAQVRGYNNDKDMMKELNDYKINIGTALYLEKNLYEPALNLIYERRKFELFAAHILLAPDSTMNDAQVVELGNSLIDRIKKGEDFGELAKEYSKDRYTQPRGGVVGWVTGGLIVSPQLEDAIYQLEPGNIYPSLVKSAFGYHILKVLKKEQRKPQVKAQHILVSYRDSTGRMDSAAAKEKILIVQKKLNEGEDFGVLARFYSDDKMTGRVRGELGYIGRGGVVPQFENAAFALNEGEVSDIVETEFGYHIIKVTEIAPLPSFEEEKEELKELYKKIRYQQDYGKLVDKLKSEFNFKLIDSVYNQLLSNVDSIKVGADYDNSFVHQLYGSRNIFSIGNKNYSVDSLFNYLQYKGAFINRKFDSAVLDDAIRQYYGDKLIEVKALNYDKENQEFATLMNEYENGIYLFKILEEEIWSKVHVDSTMAKKFYDEHKNEYRWKDRIEYKEIYVTSDSLAQFCYKLTLQGNDFDSLAIKYNQKQNNGNKSSADKLVEIDVDDLAAKANSLKNVGDISEPIPNENGFSIIMLVKREPSRLKTLDEAAAEIASLIQENESKRLEDDYVSKLKKLYSPNYYYDELQKAFK